MPNPRATHRLAFFLFPFSFFVLLLLTGCNHKSATLTLRPQGQNIAFAKTFSQAYCGKESDGSYACVLVADDAPAVARASKAISPADAAPLRQVVHIKVLWRPLSGTRESTASNAAIDWYVLGDTTNGSDDLLLYQGSGFVKLDVDETSSKLTIRSSDVRPSMSRGNRKDPLGDVRVSGTIVAVNDTQRLRELINQTRQRTASIASGE
jgi:hypothetical protein